MSLREIIQKRDVSLTSPPKWLTEYLGVGTSAAGVSVTVPGSLKVTAVLAGFTILCEDTASLPLIMYRRLTRGKERATNHPYYSLLHDTPNAAMTSMSFRELWTAHMLGWGNFYAQMIWDDRGAVREMWPLNPARMEVFIDQGQRRYLYQNDAGNKVAFRQEDIFHIPAFGFDGVKGYSRISLSKNAIGLSIAAEEYGSRYFANDARPGVVIMAPAGKKMTDPARKNLIDSWNATYGNGGNNKTALLEEGLTIETIGVPANDAQFLETRQFQIAEIARIFRIPPHMLGDVTNSTSWGSGIEQQEMGYLSHTLRPWLVRPEQQLSHDLLLSTERPVYFFEHLTEAMLRADVQARYTAYATAINNGFMSPNEAREKENLNPYTGGDTYRFPLNMAEAGKVTPRNETPILLDIAERIARYETNEARDAAARWLEKGKEDKYRSWEDEFYTTELPAFIRRSYRPCIEAGIVDPDTLAAVATETSAARRSADRTASPALDPEAFIIRLLAPGGLSAAAETE